LDAFEQERLVALDECVENIFNAADSACSEDTRLRANTFILEKTHPDFQPSKKVTIEGGDNPIKVHAIHFNVPPEILQASVMDRLRVLEMLDEVEDDSVHD